MKPPEEIEAEIWQHALDLAEHTGMPLALFCSHVIEATRRLITERDEDAPRT